MFSTDPHVCHAAFEVMTSIMATRRKVLQQEKPFSASCSGRETPLRMKRAFARALEDISPSKASSKSQDSPSKGSPQSCDPLATPTASSECMGTPIGIKGETFGSPSLRSYPKRRATFRKSGLSCGEVRPCLPDVTRPMPTTPTSGLSGDKGALVPVLPQARSPTKSVSLPSLFPTPQTSPSRSHHRRLLLPIETDQLQRAKSHRHDTQVDAASQAVSASYATVPRVGIACQPLQCTSPCGATRL
mmetsp:Transcript_75161/g.138460  ORF Transcript_75161/g.138460 Transcript_75161/m.138460 type:complete len:245 (+) Transcript_75161:1-735(+)